MKVEGPKNMNPHLDTLTEAKETHLIEDHFNFDNFLYSISWFAEHWENTKAQSQF